MATSVSYFPIVKAMKGELDAMEHIDKSNQNILPIIEIPALTDKKRDTKKFEGVNNPIEFHLLDVVHKISKACGALSVFIDISAWAPDSTTENGEHILDFVIRSLLSLGMKAYPALGYDRWEDPIYKKVFTTPEQHTHVCLRLEQYAIEDAAEPEHFQEMITDIIEGIGIPENNILALVDHGCMNSNSIADLVSTTENVITHLKAIKLNAIAIAGSSLTDNISDAVKDINSTGRLLRKEVLLWKSVAKQHISSSTLILFSDYGVRSPSMSDDIIAPDANYKIRYTIDENYFIVRGCSRRKGAKGKQPHDLSKTLVASSHFMGEEYSWGDKVIKQCSEFKTGPGNLTTWISIDTNHHIVAVMNEIQAYMNTLIFSAQSQTINPYNTHSSHS